MSFEFKANKEQIVKIAVNAVNASQPMGMGFLHYKPIDYTDQDLEPNIDISTNIHIDYAYGRMVKLILFKTEKENIWGVRDRDPDIEYQSWAYKYPTYKDLIMSVEGVEVI